MKTLEPKTTKDLDADFDRRAGLVMEAVDNYHDYLQSYIYSLTHHWQDAENIIQDLWQHVVFHFKEEDINKIGFLRRKAFQIFVDHFRYQKRRASGKTVPDAALINQAAPPAAEDLSDEEETELQQRFWQQFPNINLSDLQKQCIWEYARHGKTYQELSDQTGIPKSTISSWVGLARTRIQAQLEKETR